MYGYNFQRKNKGECSKKTFFRLKNTWDGNPIGSRYVDGNPIEKINENLRLQTPKKGDAFTCRSTAKKRMIYLPIYNQTQP